MITTNGTQVIVDTPLLSAVLERGILIDLTRKADGRHLVKGRSQDIAPLSLIYEGTEIVPLGTESGDRITILPVNDHLAEFRIESWNGDGIISIAEDPLTGDLVITPGAYASRPGVRSCRWSLTGIDQALRLIAPLWQGVGLPLNDPIIHNSHFPWPFEWQAGLAILADGDDGGLWIHCRDDCFRYKALHVGAADQPDCLGFDTEAYGPLGNSLGTGGLAWRINIYQGDWMAPATQYRNWLAATYHPEQTTRPEWLHQLRFAISWCPCDLAILDALARRLEPSRVLLHIPNWRSDAYDQNYPTFNASSEGRAFIEKARQMGYKAMPHFNSIDMDPTHPTYTYLRDFQYRDIETRRLQGWTWADHMVKPLQESNAARLRHQDKNTMVKIHPGLSMWRSILTEHVRQAKVALSLDVAFLDVTLCTWNLHNCLVENMTPTEGMKRLIAQIATIDGGLCVGGEGRNEITMQDTGLSQVHLFRSSGKSIDGMERTGGYPVNEFLFGQWSRSFGYSNLNGATADSAMRMGVHNSLGALPTVTIKTALEIEKPNQAIGEMLRLAAS